MASDETTIALKRPEYLRRYFEQTGREYVTGRNIKCPDKSAHKNGDANPSAKIYENANGTAHIHCHGCGKDWDIFSLWELDNGGKFPEAKKALCAMFGIDATATSAKHTAQVHALTGSPTQAATARPEPKAEPDTQTKQHITACAIAYHNGDNAGRDYLRARGIGDETARRFGVGFDAQKNAVIIPYGYGYAMRFIAPLKRKDGSELKAMYEPKGKPRALFNGTALEQAARNGTPVYIVEGEIDALSIAEVGGIAIATGGTGSRSKAVKAITNIGRGAYIPLMDRDEAGEKAQAELERELEKVGGMVSVFKGAPELLLPNDEDGKHPKDANEALQNDKARFSARVAEIVGRAKEQAQKDLCPFNRTIGDGENAILLRRFCDIPPPQDQTEDPNALIKGAKVAALSKGEGWIVAGEPGAGKSSLIQQFMFCAAAGKEFFGFEFTRPLKVLYLQSELQSHKLKLADNSIVYGLRAHFGWNDTEIETARTNIAYDEMSIGKVCENLTAHLTRIFAIYNFDLLVVDPLITFAEGDLSLQKDAKAFFRDIWKLIGGRAYNVNETPVKFGVVILHHMGKSKTDKDGKKINRGQDATAGSYVINAWARFQLNLQKVSGSVYALQAAKNPEDGADWRTPEGEYTDTFYIKRAGRGERYWTQATPEEIAAAKVGAGDGKTAAERKAERQDAQGKRYEEALQKFVAYLKSESIAGRHLSMTNARKHAQEVFTRTIGEKVYNAFKDNLHGYGFELSEYKNGTREFIFKGATPQLPITPEAEASADDSAPDEPDNEDEYPIPF